MNHYWLALAQSLKKGRTVLVLGPDAIPFYPQGERADNAPSETTFSQLTRRRIAAELDEQISHFYERDNLFLFKSKRAKTQAWEIVEDTVRERNWLPDAELLRKIVAMPFPLVLNLNPDKYVHEAFLKYYHAPQFGYFSAHHKPASDDIRPPDGYNQPLIYNLCGSVEDALDSLVLDHHDLFKLLEKLLSDEGVPRELVNALRDAKRFVLLGFQLERWYFQLFLHYVNRLDGAFDDSNENFPILSQVSEDSREFVMKQFHIQHFATSRADFDLLFQACEQQGILRKIADPASPVELQIRTALAQDKTEEAFDLLEKHHPDPNFIKIDLPMLRGRHVRWQSREYQSTVDPAETQRERERIRYALLTFAAQVQTP